MKSKIIYVFLLIIILSSCSVFYNRFGEWKYPLTHKQIIKIKNPYFKKEIVSKRRGKAIIYLNAKAYYNCYYTPDLLSSSIVFFKKDYKITPFELETQNFKLQLDSLRVLLNNDDSIQVKEPICRGLFLSSQIKKGNVRIFNINKGKYVNKIFREWREDVFCNKGWYYYFEGDTIPFYEVTVIPGL